ncbi:phosphatase 1E [Aphelenchoides avenae]|nr:phosphatase 1E [Aphelenchus avenae]
MEDRHILLPAIVLEPGLNHKRQQDAFFAVFDGHHGPECAQYASAHFPRCLLDESVEDADEAMHNAFKKFDERLTVRCEKEASNIRSGTTAACAYLKGGIGYLGWCGDSSVGVLRPDSIVTLTRRHTPNDPEERERIEATGGVVVPIQGEMRVNGVLNISRALGDIQAKPMVSSEAEFRKYAFSDDDLVLFLSSDGIWDTLSEDEIYKLVRAFRDTHAETEYERLATFIADKAKEEGASDNLTLIAVFLKPLDVVWKRLAQ